MGIPTWLYWSVIAAGLVLIHLVHYRRRVLLWVVWHVPLGPLAPWVLGLALGRWPRRPEKPRLTHIVGVDLASSLSMTSLAVYDDGDQVSLRLVHEFDWVGEPQPLELTWGQYYDRDLGHVAFVRRLKAIWHRPAYTAELAERIDELIWGDE